MNYTKFKITSPLNSSEKNISDLRIGARFIYGDYKGLLFKTDVKTANGKFLCCDEAGKTEWIEGKEKVDWIHGIDADFDKYSCEFKSHHLRSKSS